MREMDNSEKLVESYLKSVGFTDIRYEPDGNIPPDFLVNGRIAIEVRRLNQNHHDGGDAKSRGLEEEAIPLWQRMKNYLINLGPPSPSGNYWYVYYRFGRPIPEWKDLKRKLDEALKPFMVKNNPLPFDMEVSDGFSISVSRSTMPRSSCFTLAGCTDRQSGGWLLHEIHKNLHHCVVEKTTKIDAYRKKYAEWWLILPDHIGLGLDAFDRELFLEKTATENGAFDRIILLDPRDSTRAFQVYPPETAPSWNASARDST